MCGRQGSRTLQARNSLGPFCAAAVVALAAGALLGSITWAAKPVPSSSGTGALDEYLAAGEFNHARKVVAQTKDPAKRDEQLAQVAAAQAAAGARDAALTTTGEIFSDVARSDSLRNVDHGTSRFLEQFGGSSTPGAAGGGSSANFGPVIALIQNTIAPESWEGGDAAIQPFFNGVYVDAEGVLRRHVEEDSSGRLEQLQREAKSDAADPNARDVRRASPLRKISLPRLERIAQLHEASGKALTEDMLLLAGLERIEYVLVYPETGDLVIAGPAGDWRTTAEGREVSATSGHPIVRLDDLVTIWRVMASRPGATFGCTINPRQEALAATKAFLDSTTQKPLKQGGRHAWLKQMQKKLGQQDIEVFDLDPRTPVARVLVEADYHMKLIGMGLVEGTAEVPSYLDLIHIPKGQAPPPLDVLRWWFTLNYDAIEAAPGRAAFHLRGQGVKLQSENELLTDQGKRIQTGKAEELNREFARNFTKHYAALAAKYPVYGQLQNIFDLALCGALVASEGLADQVAWHQTYFGPTGEYQIPVGATPDAVETVVNHRLINGKHVVAGISGGVHVSPVSMVRKSAIALDNSGSLDSERARSTPTEQLPRDVWWWD